MVCPAGGCVENAHEQTELTWQLLLLKKPAVEEKMQVEGKRQSERSCLETHL